MELQWSRNFRVAESIYPPCARGGNDCFNGAATLGLRKGTRAPNRAARRAGFNGAATLGLRKEVWPVYERTLHTGFNGAATLGLRKAEERMGIARAAHELQWSRNFRVAERPSRAALSAPCSSFNGAATLGLRKVPSGHGRRRQWQRFNGAATLGLRKVADSYHASRIHSASMEPQL